MPTSPISSVNDFVVRFANVNGSGSASANELFARAVLRMGIPVSPRNIFPSNIQGLPTWYEVRITGDGHLGARGGVDLMVAMNPQTWDKDVASIEPGGYLFYDSTKPLPASKFREDITVIGVPLTEIANREYTDPRQRQLFKNIIYVGALAALLDMDVDEIQKLFGEQFKGKEKLIGSNIHALALGRDWARENLKCPLGIRLKRSDAVGDSSGVGPEVPGPIPDGGDRARKAVALDKLVEVVLNGVGWAAGDRPPGAVPHGPNTGGTATRRNELSTTSQAWLYVYSEQ